jgi:carbonyl reductase 1
MPPSASDAAPLAVVTGANRGLGLDVCRQLAARGWRVRLTARDAARAAAAAARLGKAGGSVTPDALDVTLPASVARLAQRLREEGQPIAALVNNAGVYLAGVQPDDLRTTLAVNYHGAARVTDALLPLLAPRGCLVMVSSGGGELAEMPAALRARLESPALTRAALEALLGEFQAAAERGELRGRGRSLLWPRSAYAAYGVSKAALNAFTRILARQQGPQGPRINAVCPGWVRTEMGGGSAPRGVAEGARGIVWAATLPPDGPTGGFFRDGEAIPW